MSICWAILVSDQDELVAHALIKVLKALNREIFVYVVSDSYFREIHPDKPERMLSGNSNKKSSAYEAHSFKTYCSRERKIARILIIETNPQSLSPEFLPWIGMFEGKLTQDIVSNISEVIKDILKSEQNKASSKVLYASLANKADELEKLIHKLWIDIMRQLKHYEDKKQSK